MNEHSVSTLCVASTPAQAKLFVAMLQSEGIRAAAENETLADEFAASQRLLNLAGTTVKVPTDDLERAREILAEAHRGIGDDELEAQALAAGQRETAVPRSDKPLPRWSLPLLMLCIGGIASWMLRDVVDATQSQADAFFDYEPTTDGLRQTSLLAPGHYTDLFDDNRDGFYERVEAHTPAGTTTISTDQNNDGDYDELVVRHADGTTERWQKTDRWEPFDLLVVESPNGTELQRLRWVDGRGFEPSAR